MIICDRCKKPAERRRVHIADVDCGAFTPGHDLCAECLSYLVSFYDLLLNCIQFEIKVPKVVRDE